MQKIINKEKPKTFSPNKINLPLDEKKNGILDEFIQTDDKNCQDTFTCSICSCLAWDPICCSKCDKAFCRSCLFKYGENKMCPFKCDSFTFREITRNERDYLNKIKLKCTNPGCSKYIQYSDYLTHLEKCEFRKYHCKNEPCEEIGYLNEMIEHSQFCPYRRIICEKCHLKVKYNNMDLHVLKLCPENIIKCKNCGSKMKRGIYLKEHKSDKNDNPNCLKIQLENLSKRYKEEMMSKNKEINNMKHQIKELERRNMKYKNENNDLKNNLQEIKAFITNGYNKFILEENSEKNIGNVLNINDEINKKNEIINYEKIVCNTDTKEKNMEKEFSSSGSHFYPKKKLIDSNNYFYLNKNDGNNSAKDIKNTNYIMANKKESDKEGLHNNMIFHMRKVPSSSNLKGSNISNSLKLKINPSKK